MQLMEHLCQQTREQRWITLVVLHDLNLAAQFADQLIVLAGEICRPSGPARVLDAALIERLYQVPVEINATISTASPSSEPCERHHDTVLRHPGDHRPTRWREATMNGASYWRDWQGLSLPPACSSPMGSPSTSASTH